MSVWEIVLIGIALSMDAVAVGMTNGMVEPKMRRRKLFLIAGMFGLFQFLMPVLGYYCGSVFSALVQKIAPWLSFALLGLIGGKMIFDFFSELRKRKRPGAPLPKDRPAPSAEFAGPSAPAERSENPEPSSSGASAPGDPKPEGREARGLGLGKLILQAIATSVDALAVGVTLLAAETTEGLPFHVALCALLIGAITFTLASAAVFAGKRVGDRFADKAGLLGGLILVGIGLKILIEGLIG